MWNDKKKDVFFGKIIWFNKNCYFMDIQIVLIFYKKKIIYKFKSILVISVCRDKYFY